MLIELASLANKQVTWAVGCEKQDQIEMQILTYL